MKKLLALVLAVSLSLMLVSGCGNSIGKKELTYVQFVSEKYQGAVSICDQVSPDSPAVTPLVPTQSPLASFSPEHLDPLIQQARAIQQQVLSMDPPTPRTKAIQYNLVQGLANLSDSLALFQLAVYDSDPSRVDQGNQAYEAANQFFSQSKTLMNEVTAK